MVVLYCFVFLFSFVMGNAQHCSCLLLALHSVITTGRLGGLDRMLGIDLFLTACKKNVLPTVLSLWPRLYRFIY